MAKEAAKPASTLHRPVVPRVQTAVAWLREMRKTHGDRKVKKGYDAKVSE